MLRNRRTDKAHAHAMFSIQSRLKLLFVVIVTTVLTISGSYAQYSLGKELEMSYQRLCEGVLTRLQISLPAALWDLDKTKVDTIVARRNAAARGGGHPRLRQRRRPVCRQGARRRTAPCCHRQGTDAGRACRSWPSWCSATPAPAAPPCARSSVGKVVVVFQPRPDRRRARVRTGAQGDRGAAAGHDPGAGPVVFPARGVPPAGPVARRPVRAGHAQHGRSGRVAGAAERRAGRRHPRLQPDPAAPEIDHRAHPPGGRSGAPSAAPDGRGAWPTCA